MWKVIIGLLIVGAAANANQGIENGVYKVRKDDGQNVRQFIMKKDGYINITPMPTGCLHSLSLLDANNRVIRKYRQYQENNMNEKIPAGKYYIQVIPVNDCTINVTLPY